MADIDALSPEWCEAYSRSGRGASARFSFSFLRLRVG
jgi:hypothetical protein